MISNLRKISPKEAFDKFAGSDEKRFLSNFKYDNPPVTDIKEICRIYSREIPGNQGLILSIEEINHIEELLIEHLEAYVEIKGGINKLDLYTEEELNKMDEEDCGDVIEMIRKANGVSREVLDEYFTKVKYGTNERIECDILFIDLDMEVQEKLLEFAKKDYLKKYGDEGVLREVERLKNIGVDYEAVLWDRALEHIQTYKFNFKF